MAGILELMPTSSPANLLLIAITVAISLYAFNRPQLLDRMLFWPPGLARGEVWRLLTHGFVHADGQHLAFNMITLYFFGGLIEQVMREIVGSDQGGSIAYAIFYLAAIVFATLPDIVVRRKDATYRSLGASGGVSAVLFAFILIDPWSLIFVFFIPCPAIVYALLYTGYSLWAQRRGTDRINHSAHLAGAAFGILALVLLEPRVIDVFLSRLLHPGG